MLLAKDDISDGQHARLWPVHIDASARIYEITGPDAWTHLVDTYPLAVPASRRSDWYEATGKHLQWYLPDWAAVSADYDAVHLTVLGYLTTPGLALSLTMRPGASVLAGWDPDATFWLDPRLVRVGGRPVEWQRTRDAPWMPRSAT